MKSMTFDHSTIMSDANNNSPGIMESAGSMIGGTNCSSSINSPISNIGAAGSTKKATNEKYSLRQRQKRQTTSRGTVAAAASPIASSQAALKDISCDQQPAIVKEKPKPKAAPLSKYRRKTANARERTRMREINSAFENLRRCVPHSLGVSGRNSPNSTNEKLTKITTLRLAMKYIRSLSEALSNPGHDISFLCNTNSNDFCNYNNNVSSVSCASSSSYDDIFTQVGNQTMSMVSPVKTRPLVVKNQSRSRQKAKQKPDPTNVDISLPMSSPLGDNPADLGLLLESDGESLHLSEPCLSPLGQNMKPFNCNPATDSALELGLLLESDSDSLQFSEPCLSPLGALDSFNPFGDLLHTEFTEHTSLDMYLT